MLKAGKISLLHYYDRCFNSFCKNYRKPKLRLSKKIIHQLRVDIKYIRTIYHLLKALSKENTISNDKQIIAFDKLFNAAGKVREEQVNLSLLEKYKFASSLSLFKKYLIRRKRSALRKLHKTLHDFNVTHGRISIEKSKQSEPTDYLTENVTQTQSFIQKEIKKIKKLYPEFSAKNLHDIRKELKELNYSIIYLTEVLPNHKYLKLSEKIKSIELLIGSWHNRIMFQGSIEEFLTRDESFPEILMLKELIRNIKRANKKSIKMIDKKLGKLFG